MMKTISVTRKTLIAITFGFLSFLTFSPSTNGQTKPPEQKSCVEFTNMPAGASKPTPTQEVKLNARKFILASWDENKKTCADLILFTPNGSNFKWTYSIGADKSHKKQMTVQFFDKGTFQSTLTVFGIKRLIDNPDYALELLDENGKRMGIL